MNWGTFALIVIAALVVIAGLVWIITARRLDRLHRTVIQSRLTLNEALAHRAATAADFAACGVLDVAGAILLADAAQVALGQTHAPLSLDGLEDGPGHKRQRRDNGEDRSTTESNLSRTLRLVLDGVEHEEMDPEQQKRLDLLQESREDVKLSRRFHNAFVDQARRLRTNWVVRLGHMAGGAPMPQPVDMDDE